MQMTRLSEFTKLIRSKNAGPFELTFDIMFKDIESFRRILDSGRLSPESISRLYRVPLDKIRFFALEQICSIKISIPRPVSSGSIADTDIYGGQFHGPLVNLVVETD